MMYGWIIGLILVIVLIVSFNRGGGLFPKKSNQSFSKSSALEKLKNRYANGDIDIAEFEERKTELEKTN